MRIIIITLFIIISQLMMSGSLYSQTNQNKFDSLKSSDIIVFQPLKISKQNINFYHNQKLYKNYMKLPYNKYKYKNYKWYYYNGKAEWNYFKYSNFVIKF